MRKLLYKVLRYTFIPIILRELIQRKRISILFYHNPSVNSFKAALEYLNKYYNIISLRDFIENVRRCNPFAKKTLIITFDDGYKENYLLLDAIKSFQTPATIFICSEIFGTNRHYWWTHSFGNHSIYALKKLSNQERIKIFEKYGFNINTNFPNEERQSLNIKEFNEMKNSGLIDFQAHTMYHTILISCETKEANEEVHCSKKKLEETYNLDIFAIAYPNGDYSEREVEMVKNAGYKCALTLEPGTNRIGSDPFKLKRLSISADANEDEIIVKSSGLWAILKIIKNIINR